MKIISLQTGAKVSLRKCKNNHVPAVFSKNCETRYITVDGRLAVMQFNPGAVLQRYIIVTIGRTNYYHYNWAVVASTDFITEE